MACGMLASIGDFLRMGIDEIVKNMYELSDNDEDEDMATRFGPNLYIQGGIFITYSSQALLGNPCLRHSVASNLSLARLEREL